MQQNARDKKLVKQDINFLEYPLWFQDERLPEGFVWKDRDGFVYRAAYKPPTRLDGLYLMYWMLCSQQAGWAEHICVTQRKNMTACGNKPGKRNAERLKDACERWINVTVKFKGTFYDGKRYEILQFNIINDWWVDKTTGHLRIEFNKFWLEKVKHSNFFKLVDFDEIRRLRSPRSARLYELLVKNFQARDMLTIDAHKLAHKYPMPCKYVSQIIRDVKAALDDITRNTSLQVNMSIEHYARGKAMLHFTKLSGKALDQDTSDRSPKPELPSGVRQLVCLLNEKNRREKAVIDLVTKAVRKYDANYVKRNILYANEKAEKNYRAYLDRALKEDWGLGWWEDKKKADQIGHQPVLAQQDEEQTKRERKLRLQAQAYIKNLNTEGSELLRRNALKELDRGIRNKVDAGDYFANVLLRRKMESLVMEERYGEHYEPNKYADVILQGPGK